MGTGGVCVRRDGRRRLPEAGIRSVLSEKYVHFFRLRNCSEDDSHRIYGRRRQVRRTDPSEPFGGIRNMNKRQCRRAKCGTALALAILVSSGCARSPEAREAKFLAAGHQYFDTKDYARALIQFKNAADVKRGTAEPYYQLGLAYIALGDYSSGYQALRKAVDLDPKHLPSQIKKAELEAHSSQPELRSRAEAKIREVLTQSPGNTDALSVLALAEWQLGKRENAEAELLRVLRQAPQDIQASLNLAAVKYVEKDLAGAESVMKQAAAASPKSPIPILALGDLALL